MSKEQYLKIKSRGQLISDLRNGQFLVKNAINELDEQFSDQVLSDIQEIIREMEKKIDTYKSKNHGAI
jgi:hypothetical protein